MSKLSNAALGIVAGALALGAAHFERASSDTLPALSQGDAMLRPVAPVYDVNRGGKGNRLGVPQAADHASTMFVYPVATPDTLIAARVSRKPPAPVPAARKPLRKEISSEMKIACEPLMSSLAAAAEEASPGRCMV